MNILFRRRVLALMAVLILLVVAARMNNDSNLSISAFDFFDSAEGVYSAGDPLREWVYADCSGQEQATIVLRNGQLTGAQALASLRQLSIPNWCEVPASDHPQLANWQSQVSRLQTLTATTGSTAQQILASAAELQLSSLYVYPLVSWVKQRPDNAYDFMNEISLQTERFLDGEYAQTRQENLLAVVKPALTNLPLDKLASTNVQRWLEVESFRENSDVLLQLASLDINSASIKELLLAQTAEVTREKRGQFFTELAKTFINDPGKALLLSDGIGQLPRDFRLAVTRELLAMPQSSLELARVLLEDLDDIYYGQQTELEAFILIANKLKDEADAPILLSQSLQELGDRERRIAAIHLIDLQSGNSDSFVINVLYEFDELHSQSKSQVADAIIRSRHFQNISIQQALIDSVSHAMDGERRTELLQKLLRTPGLDPGLRQRIELALKNKNY